MCCFFSSRSTTRGSLHSTAPIARANHSGQLGRHSRGHWEGETLVIETENFIDLTPSFDAIGSARNKKVTERFTRTSERVLQYSARLVDSSTFLDRIEPTFPMAKVEHRLLEYACHEGN